LHAILYSYGGEGYGESEVIALRLVASEQNPIINHTMMNSFVKYNNTSLTKCIIADKDMDE